MEMYSPNFFKPDFTENKNRFKEPEPVQVQSEVPKPAFKVKHIKPVASVRVERAPSISIVKLFNKRVAALGDYFYNMAQTFFKEEVV